MKKGTRKRRVLRGQKRHLTRPKTRKPRTKQAVIRIRPWPLHWPIPKGSAPGSVAVHFYERVVRVKIGKRFYRRLRTFSAWYLIPDKPLARWVTAVEFQEGIEGEKTFEGHEVTLREMRVYHTNEAHDFVNTESRFVWREPRHPLHIKGRGVLPPFNLLRIWFWVRRTSDRAPEGKESWEYQIWCRTLRLRESVEFSGLRAEAQNLYDLVVEEVPTLTGRSAEGFVVSSFIAWTGYMMHTKAKHGRMR